MKQESFLETLGGFLNGGCSDLVQFVEVMFVCDDFPDHEDEFLLFEAVFGGRVDSVFEC